MASSMECCFLKADVTPSQRTTAKPYESWVRVNPDGSISTAHCNCMAGTGCRAIGPMTRDRRSRHALEPPLAQLREADALPTLPSATVGMSPADRIDTVEESAML
ncbi:hypothetical protein MTO96_034571 [Rhipicephalus appendiculatus]